MKTRKTEHKSIKILKAASLILFLALLFTPEWMNRSVIAGIAITGIAGSLFFLLLPMLPQIQFPSFQRNTRPREPKNKKRKQKGAIFDMETLLIRQISYQVTDKIKAAFPDASWEYTRPIKAESLLNCDSIRIRTFHTGDYNFADVSLDQYGHLKLFMMTITDFTPIPGQKDPDPKPDGGGNPVEPPARVDPESWYSLIGKPLLMELIGDLQARGHQKLFIKESGEIFIMNNDNPEVKDTFQHFPSRDYWAALTDIFTRDGLKAAETNDTLELSWV
ncbi:hypothetical protein AALD74_12175 [Lachnospiraceae bacterium 48-21]